VFWSWKYSPVDGCAHSKIWGIHTSKCSHSYPSSSVGQARKLKVSNTSHSQLVSLPVEIKQARDRI